MNTYGLYYTLNKNIKKKSSSKDVKKLHEWLLSIEDPAQAENVFMLIYEHARVTGFDFKKSQYPYEMTYKKGNINFNLEKLPNELVQILAKFRDLNEES